MFCLFKKISTESERLPERPYPSSFWPPRRGLFTRKLLLECTAKRQSPSPEPEVVSWQLLWTTLPSLLWMDPMTHTVLEICLEAAGLKTVEVTFIQSGQMGFIIYFFLP